MDVMKQSTSVYMITDEEGDCKDPPSDDDQMMKYDAAMTVACEDVSDYTVFELVIYVSVFCL